MVDVENRLRGAEAPTPGGDGGTAREMNQLQTQMALQGMAGAPGVVPMTPETARAIGEMPGRLADWTTGTAAPAVSNRASNAFDHVSAKYSAVGRGALEHPATQAVAQYGGRHMDNFGDNFTERGLFTNPRQYIPDDPLRLARGSLVPGATVGLLAMGITERPSSFLTYGAGTAAVVGLEGATAARHPIAGGLIAQTLRPVGESAIHLTQLPFTGTYNLLTRNAGVHSTDAIVLSGAIGLTTVALIGHGLKKLFSRESNEEEDPIDNKLAPRQATQLEKALKKRNWKDLIKNANKRSILQTLGLTGLTEHDGLDEKEIPQNHFAATIAKIEEGRSVSDIRAGFIAQMRTLSSVWHDGKEGDELEELLSDEEKGLRNYLNTAEQSGRSVERLGEVANAFARSDNSNFTLELKVKNAQNEEETMVIQDFSPNARRKFRNVTPANVYRKLGSGISFMAKDGNGVRGEYVLRLRPDGSLTLSHGSEFYEVTSLDERASTPDDGDDGDNDNREEEDRTNDNEEESDEETDEGNEQNENADDGDDDDDSEDGGSGNESGGDDNENAGEEPNEEEQPELDLQGGEDNR